MADIAQMIYNYNPQGYYEQNRYRSLMADAQNLANLEAQAKMAQQNKIRSLQEMWANGDETAGRQLAVYDPEGYGKTANISRAAWQDAGRFARAYNNASDEMKPAIAKQMIGYMGKTYGNSLISDIPPISGTANFGSFMNGLAQAVDNMDISGGDIYQSEQAMARQRYAEEAADRRMYAREAMQERAVQRALDQREQIIQKALDDGDITPEQARMARLESMGIKSAPATIDPKATMDLRKEWRTNQKAYYDVGDSYNKLRNAAKNPSAAGDISMVFSYMKMLDPGSVVREGEYATAQNAAGVPTRVQNVYNNMLNGTRLSGEQRDDFLKQAGNLFKAQKDRFDNEKEVYKNIAISSGLNPDFIINDPYESLMQEQEANSQLMVQIKAPNGKTYNVPENQVEKALSQGGKRL